MNATCTNCGASVIEGAGICPVCRQPIAGAQGTPDINSWPQPQGPTPSSRMPQARKSKGIDTVWIVAAVCIALLLLIGVGGVVFYLSLRRNATLRDNDNDYASSNNSNVNSDYRQSNTGPSLSTNANEEEMPPPPPPALPTPITKSPTTISGGVLNGKALSLPKPEYPKVAKAAHASGTVTVQVTVDEAGKVTTAKAIGGHPLLQQAAVKAAYQARFSPTLLSGKPVKLTGVLTYNFVAE